MIPQMVSRICQRLINKVWRSYADDLDRAPHAEGIYTIGFEHPDGEVEYIYVGRSNDIRRRLQEHKRQDLDIDEFVKDQFRLNSGQNLGIKWVEEKDSECVEGKYLDCMHNKLGYWPEYNKKKGNQCNQCN